MRIGVLAVQGAVSEHIKALEKASLDSGIPAQAIGLRTNKQLEEVSAVVIPGGESTTISRLIDEFELREGILKRAREGMPVMGTCAGCILMAKRGDEEVQKTKTRLLSLMDMAVSRNAFGRQRESFEAVLEIENMKGGFRGVFIRAPAITEVWGDCKVLSRLEDVIVMAQQKSLLALSFHPELSGDSRIHQMLLELI